MHWEHFSEKGEKIKLYIEVYAGYTAVMEAI